MGNRARADLTWVTEGEIRFAVEHGILKPNTPDCSMLSNYGAKAHSEVIKQLERDNQTNINKDLTWFDYPCNMVPNF